MRRSTRTARATCVRRPFSRLRPTCILLAPTRFVPVARLQAVEPTMKVETKDKGIMAYAPVAAVALTAPLSIPLLPLLFGANPDQA